MTLTSSKIVSEGRVQARPRKTYSYILKDILALNCTEKCPCAMSNDSMLLMKIKRLYRVKGSDVFSEGLELLSGNSRVGSSCLSTSSSLGRRKGLSLRQAVF